MMNWASFAERLLAVAAVPDEQLGQMMELGDGEVGGERGLSTFFADNADADVGGLNHGNVVAAVANATDAFVGKFSDQVGYVGLLGRGTAAGYDSGQ